MSVIGRWILGQYLLLSYTHSWRFLKSDGLDSHGECGISTGENDIVRRKVIILITIFRENNLYESLSQRFKDILEQMTLVAMYVSFILWKMNKYVVFVEMSSIPVMQQLQSGIQNVGTSSFCISFFNGLLNIAPTLSAK